MLEAYNYRPTCDEEINSVNEDLRYRFIESPKISEKELYRQNNILQILDQKTGDYYNGSDVLLNL